MSNSDFVTVFNVADAGYRYWQPPVLGVFFIALGTIFKKVMQEGAFPEYRNKIFRRWFPTIAIVFTVFWTGAAFLGTFGSYHAARANFLSGNTQFVEGSVQDFVPLVPHRNQESFDVNGVSFHYSDYILTPGFNQTVSQGGPVREGTYVRIWYSGNDILKLQIRK